MTRYLLAVLLGIAGSVIAIVVQLPIPWLIGSLTVCAIATWIGLPVTPLPNYIERWMRVVIGVSLGPSVANSISSSSGDLLLAIAAAVVITLLSVVLGTRWFVSLTDLPRPSAFLTALPGGLSMLLAITGDLDNRALIVLAHTVRVVIVVVSISLLARALGVQPLPDPFLASLSLSSDASPWILAGLIIGCFVMAEKINIAGSHVILPMIITAALSTLTGIELAPPEIVKTIALLVFGIVLGSEVAGGPKSAYARLASVSALFTVAIMLLGAALAWALAFMVDQPFLVLFLALAPGGIAEVSLVALALGLDAGMVALVHSCRFLFIILAAPVGLRWLTGKR